MSPWLLYPKVLYAKKVLSGKKKKFCPRVAFVLRMRVRYKIFFFAQIKELIKRIKKSFCFCKLDEN
jgi:hypothetical protein